jgi:hypothetical protein
MKKRILLTLVAATLFSGLHAQRNCGTTAYYELRKSTDPAVEQRMHQQETLIQNWIQYAEQTKTPGTVFPRLKGFTPTGNAQADQMAYRTAKEKYLAQQQKPKRSYNDDELKTLRDQKRTRYYLTH